MRPLVDNRQQDYQRPSYGEESKERLLLLLFVANI